MCRCKKNRAELAESERCAMNLRRELLQVAIELDRTGHDWRTCYEPGCRAIRRHTGYRAGDREPTQMRLGVDR